MNATSRLTDVSARLPKLSRSSHSILPRGGRDPLRPASKILLRLLPSVRTLSVYPSPERREPGFSPIFGREAPLAVQEPVASPMVLI